MSITRADLHIHPSGDSWRGEQNTDDFLEAIVRSELSLVALTDHDRIDRARELVAQAVDRGLVATVLVGEEISTRDGHLLGLGLCEIVSPGLSLGDSVAAVHDQGALAVVAHPLLPTVISAQKHLLADLAQGDNRRRPDAIEAFNPMAAWLPGEVAYVTRFARRHGYPVVGGSDSHRAAEVGAGFTRFEGHTLEDLRLALATKGSETGGRPYGPRLVVSGVLAQLRARAIRLV